MATVYPQSTYPTYAGQQASPGGGYVTYSAPPQSGYPPPPQEYAPPGQYPPPGYGASVPNGVDPGAYYNANGGMPPHQGIPQASYNPGYQQPGYAQPHASGYNAVVIPMNDPPAKQEVDPANRIETGRWSAGLCSCCDSCCPNLCMSWCCPCVSLAQIYARMALTGYFTALFFFSLLVLIGFIVQNVPIETPGPDDYQLARDEYGNYYFEAQKTLTGIIVPYVVWSIVEVLFCYSVCFARRRVRQRFQIPGSCCCDCMISCCCSCCAIAQMATHVKSYKPGSCDFGGPNVLPAYTG